MSAAGSWFITPHAVRRYIERHRPGLSYDHALTELVWWSEVSEVKCETRSGERQFNAEWPARLRFIVTRDAQHGGLATLLTVLPSNRRQRWLNLSLDVELEFKHYQSAEDRADRLESLLPQWLAVRRAQYAIDRREDNLGYRAMLRRARGRATSRQRDPVRRAMAVASARMVHTQRRAEEVATRPPCPECGAAIALVARMGRVRKFCSQRCTHRAASRAWWQRHSAKMESA